MCQRLIVSLPQQLPRRCWQELTQSWASEVNAGSAGQRSSSASTLMMGACGKPTSMAYMRYLPITFFLYLIVFGEDGGVWGGGGGRHMHLGGATCRQWGWGGGEFHLGSLGAMSCGRPGLKWHQATSKWSSSFLPVHKQDCKALSQTRQRNKTGWVCSLHKVNDSQCSNCCIHKQALSWLCMLCCCLPFCALLMLLCAGRQDLPCT